MIKPFKNKNQKIMHFEKKIWFKRVV